MKFKDVVEMPVEELRKKANELKKNIFEMRMKNALGQLNNPVQLRTLRKDVAQVMTALNQKLTR